MDAWKMRNATYLAILGCKQLLNCPHLKMQPINNTKTLNLEGNSMILALEPNDL